MRLPALSLGRVTFLDDSTFTADPLGKEAVLIPVHDRYGRWVDTCAYCVAEGPAKPVINYRRSKGYDLTFRRQRSRYRS